MIHLKTFYPYTNESIDAVNQKLEGSDFDGIVLPVAVEQGRGASFRILKRKNFTYGNFLGTGDFLADFLRKTNLHDKEIFLSVIGLFNALGGGGKSKEELENYEVLRKAIAEIHGVVPKMIVNNNLYDQVVAREEFFPNLQKEFPNIDYAYTMFNRNDNLSEHKNIVVRNVYCSDVITYINLGKNIYLPQFERKSSIRDFSFEDLLEYYKPDEDSRMVFSFKEAELTVISKENANNTLKKILGKNRNI